MGVANLRVMHYVHKDKAFAYWSCTCVYAPESRYCSEEHKKMALAEREYELPHNFANVHLHTNMEDLVLPKIISYLRDPQLGIIGIPNLQYIDDVFNVTPTEQPDMFSTNLDEREEFNIWLFMMIS